MVGASLHFCLALLLLYLRRASDRGAKRRTDTARVLKTGFVACWRATVGCWAGCSSLSVAWRPCRCSTPGRPASARHPAGSGALRLVLERRAARQFFRPSAFAELPTTRPSCARLAGSAAANSAARCVAPEFMPNLEPAARGRHAELAWLAPTGCIGHPAPMCACSQRQLPRGQRRRPRRTGRPHCERARARACRLAAGVGRASRAERRPRNALARALTLTLTLNLTTDPDH
jgi:hypothetical protein